MARIPNSQIELSYVDLLTMLSVDVESDCIPAKEKEKIEKRIEELKNMLFPYSY